VIDGNTINYLEHDRASVFLKRHNVCDDIRLVVETVVALDHQVLACGPAHWEYPCQPRYTNKMYDHKMKDRLSAHPREERVGMQ
jgi:hypothetical protein